MIDMLFTKIAAYGRVMETIGYYSCLAETDPLMIKARRDAQNLWIEIEQLINQHRWHTSRISAMNCFGYDHEQAKRDIRKCLTEDNEETKETKDDSIEFIQDSLLW